MGCGALCGSNKSVMDEQSPWIQGIRRPKQSKQDRTCLPSPIPTISQDYRSIPNEFNKKSADIDSQYGIVGLKNLGNTCFINSALQCLTNAQPLTDYILAGVHEQEINESNEFGTGGELTLAFAELVTSQWQDEFESIVPIRLINLIDRYGQQFADGKQHDVQEFLSFFIDKLHEDLNRAKADMDVKLTSSGFKKSQERMAAQAWNLYLRNNSSIIVDLFQGQFKSTLKCTTWGFMSITFDTYMYLTLPISRRDANPTLEQCLNSFTKTEKLKSDEKWTWEKWGKNVEALKKLEVWKFPPILIIHLKRFRYSTKRREKVQKFVTYPIKDFDATEFEKGNHREPPIYDLFAVSNHSGKLSHGHYTAMAKNKNNQKWYQFDDTKTKKIKKSEVVNKNAYLLFYSKSTVPEFRRQSVSQPDLWPHVFLSTENSRESSRCGSIVGSFSQKPNVNINRAEMSASEKTEGTEIQDI